MSLPLFERVITEVSKFTNLVALHLMGDPLVHPELESILDLCRTHQTKVFLVTNGLLIKNPQLLLHETIQQVSFSLHSFKDNFPQKDPSEYLENIFKFTEIAFKERPKLFINYRLWNLKSKSGNDSQNEYYFKEIEKRFNVTIPRGIEGTEKKAIKLKNYLSLHFDVEFTWPGLELAVISETGTCYGLKSHFGVLVDGTVVPCCLDKEGNIPLGNLNQEPLQQILASPRAINILKGFNQNRLIEDLCKRCQYRVRFP